MHAWIHACMDVCMQVYICMYVYVYVCVYVCVFPTLWFQLLTPNLVYIFIWLLLLLALLLFCSSGEPCFHGWWRQFGVAGGSRAPRHHGSLRKESQEQIVILPPRRSPHKASISRLLCHCERLTGLHLYLLLLLAIDHCLWYIAIYLFVSLVVLLGIERGWWIKHVRQGTRVGKLGLHRQNTEELWAIT